MIWFLYLPFVLFLIGVYGIFFSRKNIIIVIMSIELLLLACNLNFLLYSLLWWDLVGQIFTLIILTVAASESAIGLAILVVFYRLQGYIAVDSIQNIKG